MLLVLARMCSGKLEGLIEGPRRRGRTCFRFTAVPLYFRTCECFTYLKTLNKIGS